MYFELKENEVRVKAVEDGVLLSDFEMSAIKEKVKYNYDSGNKKMS